MSNEQSLSVTIWEENKAFESLELIVSKRGKRMRQLDWSNWMSLKTLDFGTLPSSSGIYQIRWAIDGKPQLIHRANGDDDCGVLYVGKSKVLRSRVRNFWQYVISKRGLHTAGWTYFYFNFEKKFKQERLEIRWAKLPEDEIDEMEDFLLEEYASKYLDKPPLNINLPRH